MKWIVFLMSFMAASAFAENVNMNLNWQNPVTYDNGDQLKFSEIDSYELHYSVNEDFKPMAKPIKINPTTGAYNLSVELDDSIKEHVIHAAMRTITTKGGVSDFSDVVSKTFTIDTIKIPSAPRAIEFEITCDGPCTIVTKIKTTDLEKQENNDDS